jgi:hypothetical protein
MGIFVDYLPNLCPLKSPLTLVVTADRVQNKCLSVLGLSWKFLRAKFDPQMLLEIRSIPFDAPFRFDLTARRRRGSDELSTFH